MANVLVEESCLSGIASAIRNQMEYKNTPYYKPSEMAGGINDLKAKVAWSLLVAPSTMNTSSLIGSTTFYSSTNNQLPPLAFCDKFNSTINTIDLPNMVACIEDSFSISGATRYIGGQFWGLSYVSSIFLSSYISWKIPGFLFAECHNLSDLRLGSKSHNYTNIGENAFFSCSSLSEIPSNILMSDGTIGSYAFAGCINLTNINNLSPSYINEYAFRSCSKITSIFLANCVSISSFAFGNCSNLTSIYLPKLSSLTDYAFTGCNLTGSIELPKLNPYRFDQYMILNYASATNRFTLNLPICTSIWLPNYSWCTKLWAPVAENVSMNGSLCYISEIYVNSTALSLYASGNISLVKVSTPNASAISANAFNGCTNLSDITVTAVTTVYSSAFKSCYNLSKLSLPSASVIYPFAFSYCSKLNLYLMGSSVCKLSGTATNTFTGCDILSSTVNNNTWGSIYVPSSLYATYKASTNWVTISSRFASI